MKTEDQMKYILAGIETSFDKMQLTLRDVMYIAILRKLSTLEDPRVTVRYACPVCKRVGTYSIKCEEIEFNDIVAPELPVRAPFSFGELVFAPLTMERYFKLIKDEDKKDWEDDMGVMAGRCVSLPMEKAYEVIGNITKRSDIELLEEIDKALEHGVKKLEHVCKIEDPKTKEPCDAKIKIGLDGGQALLLPFREHKQSPKSGLKFGYQDRS